MEKFFINERLLPLASNPETLIVYPHTPRTGGVTMRKEVLARVFGEDKVYNRHYTPDPVRWKCLSESDLKDYRAYTELYYCRDIGLRRPALFIATLRHPVYRAASLYGFVKRKNTHRDYALAVKYPMEEFYRRASASAPHYYRNAQCHRIAGRADASRALALIQEKYIGVGFTNYLADFALELCRVFNWPRIELERRTLDPERYDAHITPAFRDMVLAENAQDLKLYEAVAKGLPQLQAIQEQGAFAVEAARRLAALRASLTRLLLGHVRRTESTRDVPVVASLRDHRDQAEIRS
jgi:hypothetical protein